MAASRCATLPPPAVAAPNFSLLHNSMPHSPHSAPRRQNNYSLSKHLTEQAVAARHGAPFAVHIARPAFVIAVAGRPYPGRAAAASACRARPPRKPPCFQFKT